MRLFIAILLPTLAATREQPKYSPCNNFLMHTCFDVYPDRPSSVISENEAYDEPIDYTSKKEYQGLKTTSSLQRDIFELVRPHVIYTWINQFITQHKNEGFVERTRTVDLMTSWTLERQILFVEEELLNLSLESVHSYYKAIQSSINFLDSSNYSAKWNVHNAHRKFKSIKDMLIKTVQDSSLLGLEEKDHMENAFKNSSLMIGALDFTDISKYIHAKTTYDVELKRLWSLTNSKPNHMLEKILHIGAIHESVKILSEYTNHTMRFVFQAILSFDGSFAYNYEREIFISYKAFDYGNDQHKIFDWGYFAYVLGHELTHSVFGNHEVPFQNVQRLNQEMCIVDFMNDVGKEYAKKIVPITSRNQSWSAETTKREDVASIEGLRAAYNAFKRHHARSDEDLRQFLYGFAHNHCPKTHPIRLYAYDGIHSPFIFTDAFAAQLPDFKRLFSCSEDDKLYLKEDQYCSVFGLHEVKQHHRKHHREEYKDLTNSSFEICYMLLALFIQIVFIL